ncbi:MAG: SDR family NAD(P)-dependent oxidoreductase [Polyangiales bacterium]
MKVLVTGGTGLAGSHTIRELLQAGHSVRALVRSESKLARVFPDAPGGLSSVVGDIADEASVRAALDGCDGLVHAAAIVSIDNASTEALIEANVGGVKKVLGAALDAGVRHIVHVSSLSALFHVEPSGQAAPITPDTEPHESEHAYGLSKAMAERWVRDQQAAGAPIWTTYPSAVLAPDDPGMTESTNALRIFAGRFVPLTPGGFQFVDARDLAIAHRLLLEDGPSVKRHLVPGHYLPWRDLHRGLRAAGARSIAMPLPGGLLRATGVVLDGVRKAVPVPFPITREAMQYATRWTAVDSSPELAALGLDYRPAAETLGDTTAWLRSAGHIR